MELSDPPSGGPVLDVRIRCARVQKVVAALHVWVDQPHASGPCLLCTFPHHQAGLNLTEAVHTTPADFPPWWELAAPPPRPHLGETDRQLQCVLPVCVCSSCAQ
eukprot:GHVS01077395.1.p2 GENE.GHVS01077395.1~~GHVS01077395.1.p2  ORF type:complete len:104 (-),score=11.52 GHVS01077395.1:189-500(-)